VQRQSRLKNVICYTFSIILAIFILIPFYWMVVTSLKSNIEVFAYPISYWPKAPTLAPYIAVLKSNNVDFLKFFMNSMIISVTTAVLSVIIASFAGYAFARYNFKSKNILGISLLSTQMLPQVLFIIPFFFIFKAAGLYNTIFGLILAYLTFALPFCIWMLRGYFMSLPVELEEAARIDGCTRLQVLFKIVLPLARPALVSTGIFAFIHAWNEFLFAFIVSPKNPTLTVGLYQYIGATTVSWNNLMAHATMSIIPCIIIFIFLQRYLVSGLTAGAVKS
jgi:multiple sugar transport system permease protein